MPGGLGCEEALPRGQWKFCQRVGETLPKLEVLQNAEEASLSRVETNRRGRFLHRIGGKWNLQNESIGGLFRPYKEKTNS